MGVGGGERVVVLLPGRERGPRVALLDYAAEAAEARGARVEPVLWRGNVDPVPLDGDTQTWVEHESRRVLDELRRDGDPRSVVVVAKSLGTLAAPVVAELGLPAVWFTPVLTGVIAPLDPSRVVEALSAASAPALLVGGTGDSLWDGERARATGCRVVEVPGADHNLHVPGPLAASAEVLGRVVTHVEQFLDDVWET